MVESQALRMMFRKKTKNRTCDTLDQQGLSLLISFDHFLFDDVTFDRDRASRFRTSLLMGVPILRSASQG